MKPRNVPPILILNLGILAVAVVGFWIGSRMVLCLLPMCVTFLTAWIGRSASKAGEPWIGWTLRRYRPRKTDAGKWVDAPIAELDKSTCGKLLASRMRREPGLHVVVRPEAPPPCTDALYDPELDGGR